MGSIMDRIAGNYKENPGDAKISKEAEDLIEGSFSDIRDGDFRDYHMHIFGLGTNDSEIWLSEDLFSLLHPSDSAKTQLFINAAGIKNEEEGDKEYLEQLLAFVNLMPVNGKFQVLALDRCYTKDGEVDEENSKMYVPNEWV